MKPKKTTKTAAALIALAAVLAGCESPTEETTASTSTATAAAEVSAPLAGPAALARHVGDADLRAPSEPLDRERYQHLEENPVKLVAEAPVSTFSVDVDTGSYSNVRRFLDSGRMPPGDAVRIEELVNYFDYAYPGPKDRQQPFAVTTEVARTPWNPDTHLLRIGIKGFDIELGERPPANLVFLVDVSGSMDMPDKLPLVIRSLKLLTQKMTVKDRISLVVYAGAAGAVLEPTPGDERAKIRAALERLRAGGRTAGAAGIKLAYDFAEKAWIEGGINRVILATDGDFNVGVANVEALKDLVARKRKTGITLTVLGFGTGNYQEALIEQIADVGNGNYAYIDRLAEARKVLVRDMSSTLFTIAQDVKVQIEFNPAVVGEYRLIGFENRLLAREDFRNDKVDAGDIGAGHTVTALYEIALVDSPGLKIDPLRYQATVAPVYDPGDSEFALLKLRYKLPGEDESRLIEQPLERALLEDGGGNPSADFRFAAAVSAFGQILRDGRYTNGFGYDDVRALARDAKGEDRFGYRAGFLELVDLAQDLDPS